MMHYLLPKLECQSNKFVANGNCLPKSLADSLSHTNVIGQRVCILARIAALRAIPLSLRLNWRMPSCLATPVTWVPFLRLCCAKRRPKGSRLPRYKEMNTSQFDLIRADGHARQHNGHVFNTTNYSKLSGGVCQQAWNVPAGVVLTAEV